MTSLTETVAPIKPSSKIIKSDIVKNKNMINQKQLIQYKFDTKNGNNVKVQFTKPIENKSDVVFYVNDTLDDGSSGERDEEILNGVLWILKNIPNKLHLNTITFSAWSGKGDTKILKNIPIKDRKENFITHLKIFENALNKFEPNPIPHSQLRIDLSKKLNKPLIQLYNVDKEYILKILQDIHMHMKTDDTLIKGDIDKLNELFYNNDTFKSLNNIENLIKSGFEYAKSILSNTEFGAIETKNRRQSLYHKILNKYFNSEWHIEQSGPNFTITKRQTHTIENLKESLHQIFKHVNTEF